MPCSSMSDDALILVDENDREIGTQTKSACHAGDGLLHRAFSVLLFNGSGKLLLQQRSALKPLWPGYWSNSCCSHPRVGETVPDAARRRLSEELGVDCELQALYKFVYRARFGEVGTEHECCWVLVGHSDNDVEVDPEEVADYRWIAPDELTREIAAHPDRFTPWFKLEWQEIQQNFEGIING